MADLDRLRARARAAGEASLLRSALRPSPWLSAYAVAVAVSAPEAASLLAAVALGAAIVLLGWRRPRLGGAAWQGFVVGAPVSLAALFARGCAPAASEWACGVGCFVVGMVWATVVPRPRENSALASAVSGATAGLAALVGCSALGLGVGLAVAAALTVASTTLAMLRPAAL